MKEFDGDFLKKKGFSWWLTREDETEEELKIAQDSQSNTTGRLQINHCGGFILSEVK